LPQAREKGIIAKGRRQRAEGSKGKDLQVKVSAFGFVLTSLAVAI